MLAGVIKPALIIISEAFRAQAGGPTPKNSNPNLQFNKKCAENELLYRPLPFVMYIENPKKPLKIVFLGLTPP